MIIGGAQFRKVDNMRVISGTARGRKLKELSGMDIRPTSDLVKESVFNIVQFDIEGRRILDLYAGTGQIGIEALSRGAASLVFVDSDESAIKLIRENVEKCGFMKSSVICRRDALEYLERCEPFDLIFIDPPYDSGLAAETLRKIIEFDKLNTNGIIMCEMRTTGETPAAAHPYFLQKEYVYGKVKILRYSKGEPVRSV